MALSIHGAWLNPVLFDLHRIGLYLCDGLFMQAPVVTSNRHPCQGQVTMLPSQTLPYLSSKVIPSIAAERLLNFFEQTLDGRAGFSATT